MAIITSPPPVDAQVQFYIRRPSDISFKPQIITVDAETLRASSGYYGDIIKRQRRVFDLEVDSRMELAAIRRAITWLRGGAGHATTMESSRERVNQILTFCAMYFFFQKFDFTMSLQKRALREIRCAIYLPCQVMLMPLQINWMLAQSQMRDPMLRIAARLVMAWSEKSIGSVDDAIHKCCANDAAHHLEYLRVLIDEMLEIVQPTNTADLNSPHSRLKRKVRADDWETDGEWNSDGMKRARAGTPPDDCSDGYVSDILFEEC